MRDELFMNLFFLITLYGVFYQMHYVLIGDRSTTSHRPVSVQLQSVTEDTPTRHRLLSNGYKTIAVSTAKNCRSIDDKLQNLSPTDRRSFPYSRYGQKLVDRQSVAMKSIAKRTCLYNRS